MSDQKWKLVRPHLPYRVAGKWRLDDRRIISGIILSGPIVMYQIDVEILGWPKRSDDLIEEAVNYGHFDNMRKLEETNALNNVRLRPPETGDPEGFEMRKVKVGGYLDYMSENDIAYVTDCIATELYKYYGMYK